MSYTRRTTYQIGLVQAQAYRNLQSLYREALEPYKLTIPEWSLLGLLNDRGQITMSELTEAMQSKASHPTNLVNQLVRRQLVRRASDAHDRRAKRVELTEAGTQLVATAEATVRAAMLSGVELIRRNDLEVYFRVLQALARGEDEASANTHSETSGQTDHTTRTVGCSDFGQSCAFRITADAGQEDMMVEVATAHALRYHSEFSDDEAVFRTAIRAQIMASEPKA